MTADPAPDVEGARDCLRGILLTALLDTDRNVASNAQAITKHIEALIDAKLATLRESRPVAPAAQREQAGGESECVATTMYVLAVGSLRDCTAIGKQALLEDFKAALARELEAAFSRGYEQGHEEQMKMRVRDALEAKAAIQRGREGEGK